MAVYKTNSPLQSIELGKKVGSLLKGGEVIAYTGDLGAGKTTFTRGLAMGMGLSDDVTSPTFTLVNEYTGKINLYHFDMYRIMNSTEIEVTGFYEYMTKNNVLAVEWSENISDALPLDTIYINIQRISDEERNIEIIGDDRFENISY